MYKMGQPVQIQFPLLGINKGMVTTKQLYATSSLMNNVRPYDVLDKRARGGQRPGITGWGNEDLIGDTDNPVVAVCSVSSIL